MIGPQKLDDNENKYEFQAHYANCIYSISALGDKSGGASIQCAPAGLHLWAAHWEHNWLVV